MKKIIVNDKCNACGLCTIGNDFLEENIDGTAKPIVGKYILPSDEDKVNDVVDKCPQRAIQLVVCEDLGSKKDVIESAINELSEIEDLPKVTTIKDSFDKSDYQISCGNVSGQYNYEYSSSSAAERAAYSAFERAVFSNLDSIIMKIVVQYKAKHFAKYMLTNSGNIYENKNNEIISVLKNIAGKYEAVCKQSLEENFAKFIVSPDTDRYSTYRMFERNELFVDSAVSRIRSEFKSSDYGKVSAYIPLYCDIDDMEKSVPTFGGRYKEKTMYCYGNMYEACNEFIGDLLHSAYMSTIDELAVETANFLQSTYNTNMRKALKEKIEYLKSLM